MEDSVILGLSEDIVEQRIEIRKEHKIKTPDAIIAATALKYGLILISRNIRDFKNIKGLEVINHYEAEL